MPHAEVKCFAGRTEEQKRLCAERIAEVIAETLGCETSGVSVAIKEVEKGEWKAEVWDKVIVPDREFLYTEPGYSYEED